MRKEFLISLPQASRICRASDNVMSVPKSRVIADAPIGVPHIKLIDDERAAVIQRGVSSSKW